MESALPLAFSPLGLKPWEFRRLGVDEFYSALKAVRATERERALLSAYFVNWQVLAVTGRDCYDDITAPLLTKAEQAEREKAKEQALQAEKEYFTDLLERRLQA